RLMPKTEKEFLEVNGVGKVKAEKYGARFLSVIASYLEG
ncbi:MAG: HRDC domain-containing protein, partial [Clostridia bacterium]|nr:HRDC domain-containing protein [Clostridia bacterium]